MNNKTSIAGKYDIKDIEAKKAIKTLQAAAEAKTVIKHYDNPIKSGVKMEEGVIYTDQKNDNTDQHRIIINIKGKKFFLNLTPLE